MTKWVKKKMGHLVEDPHLPLMQRMGESLATSNNNKKAKILTERFFPQPVPADLSDITGKTPATHLRVNSDITTEEMARTISCLLNNTALKLDRIPNKALKACRLLIILWLANIAKVCFVIGYYPRLRRAIIIVVLHKKGKADYSLPGNYHPIALKNTLSKILKRVIAKYIANTAEKYALLLQS